jgi:hypothetical protein
MERFAGSLLPFLIIVVVVLRGVFFLIGRGNSQRSRKNSDASPPKAARSFASWEDEFRDEAFLGANVRFAPEEDEGFSAWNLSVDEEPPPPPAPSRVLEPSGRSSFPSGPARFPETSKADPALSGPPRFPETPKTDPAPSDPPRLFETPKPREARRSAGPEQRLRYLPPLQQGLVWAEILGRPKGLED